MLTLLAACGGGNAVSPDAYDPGPEVRKFQDDAVELLRREARDVDELHVQYVLITVGIEDAGPGKENLSLVEAEKIAAEVYRRALEGADFDRLVLKHSYGRLVRGQRPGTFTLLKGDLPPNLGPTTFKREQEETNMWKAAWRLQPGEIGPVERHEKDANAGFYVVRILTDEEMAADDPVNAPPADERTAQMREDAIELARRDEHNAETVKIQHILIGRWMSPVSREGNRLSPEEAEKLAAEVWAQAKDAEDFTALVRRYSYDDFGENEPPGVYVMHDRDDRPPPGEHLRKGMVKGFGDTAWRLDVGETGVLLYDRADSPYGYHIIRRLE